MHSPIDTPSIPGWFNFQRVYDRIVSHDLEGTACVEVGVWLVKDGSGPWYLSEDYSFCEPGSTASASMADTTIRLGHVGSYRFGWEDAGSAKERFAGYTFHRKAEQGLLGTLGVLFATTRKSLTTVTRSRTQQRP